MQRPDGVATFRHFVTDLQHCRWHLYRDREELSDRAALAIARIAADCIRRKGIFRLVVSGGETPRPVYERLTRLGGDWDAWRIYFGDERCLPPDHGDRNSVMLGKSLLAHAPIPAIHVHAIPAEYGPEEGARAYRKVVDEVPTFDLTLLGLGEDGHVASLFPGAELGEEAGAPSVLPVRHAAKPPSERVTLSSRRLGLSDRMLCIVAGESKRAAVAAWRTARPIPAARVRGRDGIDVLVEQRAWA